MTVGLSLFGVVVVVVSPGDVVVVATIPPVVTPVGTVAVVADPSLDDGEVGAVAGVLSGTALVEEEPATDATSTWHCALGGWRADRDDDGRGNRRADAGPLPPVDEQESPLMGSVEHHRDELGTGSERDPADCAHTAADRLGQRELMGSGRDDRDTARPRGDQRRSPRDASALHAESEPGFPTLTLGRVAGGAVAPGVLSVLAPPWVTTSTEPKTLADRPPALDKNGAVVGPTVHDLPGAASATSVLTASDAVSARVRDAPSEVLKPTTRRAGRTKKNIRDCPLKVKGDNRSPAIRSSLCH